MILVLEDYEIEGSKLIGKYSKFSVYKNRVVEKGKLKGKKVKNALWFDTSFEKCLQTIAQDMIQSSDKKLQTEQFLGEYNKIIDGLNKQIQEVNKNLQTIIKQNELIGEKKIKE